MDLGAECLLVFVTKKVFLDVLISKQKIKCKKTQTSILNQIWKQQTDRNVRTNKQAFLNELFLMSFSKW